MDSTRMPLEVRVNDEKIIEIYRAQDFFGEYACQAKGGRRNDEHVWEELREQLSRRGARSGVGAMAMRSMAILAAIGGFVLLAAAVN